MNIVFPEPAIRPSYAEAKVICVLLTEATEYTVSLNLILLLTTLARRSLVVGTAVELLVNVAVPASGLYSGSCTTRLAYCCPSVKVGRLNPTVNVLFFASIW